MIEAQKAAMVRLLIQMVESGEAKVISGPDSPLNDIIVSPDPATLAKIVTWDIDDDDDLVFYFEGDDEPHRCENVDLW